MKNIYILLGTNLGEREKQLQDATLAIEKQIGQINKSSAIVETAAWGVEDQPTFLNQVIEVHTTMSPLDVLKNCQTIEDKLGRVRTEKWGARIIDIDILYYENEIIDLPNLQIPHPYIQDRKFTLVPLCEIAPAYRHPILQKNNLQLLHACPDNLEVHQFKEHV